MTDVIKRAEGVQKSRSWTIGEATVVRDRILPELVTELKAARNDIDCLLAVATLYIESFDQDAMMTLPEKLRFQEVENIVKRRGRRY